MLRSLTIALSIFFLHALPASAHDTVDQEVIDRFIEDWCYSEFYACVEAPNANYSLCHYQLRVCLYNGPEFYPDERLPDLTTQISGG